MLSINGSQEAESFNNSYPTQSEKFSYFHNRTLYVHDVTILLYFVEIILFFIGEKYSSSIVSFFSDGESHQKLDVENAPANNRENNNENPLGVEHEEQNKSKEDADALKKAEEEQKRKEEEQKKAEEEQKRKEEEERKKKEEERKKKEEEERKKKEEEDFPYDIPNENKEEIQKQNSSIIHEPDSPPNPNESISIQTPLLKKESKDVKGKPEKKPKEDKKASTTKPSKGNFIFNDSSDSTDDLFISASSPNRSPKSRTTKSPPSTRKRGRNYQVKEELLPRTSPIQRRTRAITDNDKKKSNFGFNISTEEGTSTEELFNDSILNSPSTRQSASSSRRSRKPQTKPKSNFGFDLSDSDSTDDLFENL